MCIYLQPLQSTGDPLLNLFSFLGKRRGVEGRGGERRGEEGRGGERKGEEGRGGDRSREEGR